MTHVLVVDDDRLLAQLVKDVLEDEGYCVKVAASAAAANDCIAEHWPEVMLLDVRMPGIDGWAFLGVCQHDPCAADLQIVMVSAAHEADRAQEQGVAFLEKPFDLNNLTRAVQQAASAVALPVPALPSSG